MNQFIKNALEIHGQTTKDELCWLHWAAKKVESIVEIGSYRGRSTYALAAGCQGKVYAVDPFDVNFCEVDDIVFDAFMANMSRFPNIEVVQMTSAVAASCPQIPAEVDMVFIDANHEYEFFMLDLTLWAPRAKKLVCGHDFGPGHPGVEKALIEYFGYDRLVLGPESLWSVAKDGFV